MKSNAFFPGLLITCMAGFAFILFSCNNESDTSAANKDSGNATTMSHDSMSHAAPVDTAMADHAQAVLTGTNPDTTVTGTVKFDKDGSKTKMTLEVSVPKLASKSVAVHFHEHGDCGDMGKMAHGHWNPTNTQHGKWGEGSFHSGDIGNIKLDSKGSGTITISSDLWTIGGTAASNVVGKSIIVHSGVDDYKSQPSGNSGSRIGCGVINK